MRKGFKSAAIALALCAGCHSAPSPPLPSPAPLLPAPPRDVLEPTPKATPPAPWYHGPLHDLPHEPGHSKVEARVFLIDATGSPSF